MRIHAAGLLALAALAALGCGGAARRAAAGAREYRGFYWAAFEEQRFVPCDSVAASPVPWRASAVRPGWWVTWAPGPEPEAPEAAGPDFRDLGHLRGSYVRWRAVLSPPGGYGHMGVWRRELRVVEALEDRAPADADCRAAPGRPAG